MNNDLISREALNEHKIIIPLCNVIGGRRCGKTREQIVKAYQKGWNDAIDAIIDNAPAVEFPEQITIKFDCDTEEDRQKLLSLIANAKVCMFAESEKPQGEWIVTAEDNDGVHRICCPFCSYEKGSNNTDPVIVTFSNFPKFCENCGADMRSGTV